MKKLIKPFLTIIVTKNLFDSPSTLIYFIQNYFDITQNSNGFRIKHAEFELMKKFLKEILI